MRRRRSGEPSAQSRAGDAESDRMISAVPLRAALVTAEQPLSQRSRQPSDGNRVLPLIPRSSTGGSLPTRRMPVLLLMEPVTIPVFDPQPDIRLIVADMDGTLLDDAKQLNEHFWPLVHELHRRGVVFSP